VIGDKGKEGVDGRHSSNKIWRAKKHGGFCTATTLRLACAIRSPAERQPPGDAPNMLGVQEGQRVEHLHSTPNTLPTPHRPATPLLHSHAPKHAPSN
jgi:hypothetical protein